MGLRKVNYVVAVCDCCGSDWWRTPPETDVPPHFDDHATARKQLAEDFGWRIERRIDGRYRMFCRSCAAKSDCELYGCDIPDTVEGRLAACLRCGQVKRDDKPRGKHPEKANGGAPLPPWLAQLDEELFGTDTNDEQDRRL